MSLHARNGLPQRGALVERRALHVNLDQAILIGDAGQRRKQRRVDEGVRARDHDDPEAQAGDDGRGEPWSSPEIACGVAEVLSETVEPGTPIRDDRARQPVQADDVRDRAKRKAPHTDPPSLRPVRGVLDLGAPFLGPAIPHRARRQPLQHPNQRRRQSHVLLLVGKSRPTARKRASASASRRFPAAVSS